MEEKSPKIWDFDATIYGEISEKGRGSNEKTWTQLKSAGEGGGEFTIENAINHPLNFIPSWRYKTPPSVKICFAFKTDDKSKTKKRSTNYEEKKKNKNNRKSYKIDQI